MILILFQIPGNVEIRPKNIIYSKKQHIFLVAYELSGGTVTNEVVLYWENTDPQFANSKVTTVKGLYFISTFSISKCIVSDYLFLFCKFFRCRCSLCW